MKRSATLCRREGQTLGQQRQIRRSARASCALRRFPVDARRGSEVSSKLRCVRQLPSGMPALGGAVPLDSAPGVVLYGSEKSDLPSARAGALRRSCRKPVFLSPSCTVTVSFCSFGCNHLRNDLSVKKGALLAFPQSEQVFFLRKKAMLRC